MEESQGEWPEDLVGFWRRYHPPGLHPADEPQIPSDQQLDWDLETARRHKRIPPDVQRRLHKSLIAHPFLGSPTEALVYILFGNPGCVPGDYEDELLNEAYISLCRSHLQGDHDFLQLEPGSEGTGGGRHWRRVFRRLAEELGLLIAPDLSELDRRETGYAKIRKRVTVLEACAYHSAKSPGAWTDKLPSSRVIYRHVHEVLLPRAKEGKILLFVWRKAEFWKLENPGCIVLRPPPIAIGKALLTSERIAIREFIRARL